VTKTLKSEPMTERKIDRQVTIDAPPEAVWKALTDGAEVERWFSFHAKVDPRVGGKLWMSWGPECEGSSTIEVCEPNRRLAWKDDAPLSTNEAGQALRLATEYQLEGQGGRTRLRIVMSGFGASGWDDELDSISRGYDVFLRGLAHYVERHQGTPRALAYAQAMVEGDLADAWARLFGPRGLGPIAATREGAEYSLVTASGRRFSGLVQVWNPPKDLAVTIRELNDAHLWVELTSWGGALAIKLTLSAYGVDAGLVKELETEWRALLASLFGGGA
jgi:uncharacterized protein YndB with AHSA1/START domain